MAGADVPKDFGFVATTTCGPAVLSPNPPKAKGLGADEAVAPKPVIEDGALEGIGGWVAAANFGFAAATTFATGF